MPARKDITGQRFGRLIAIQPHDVSSKQWRWLCQCDCGQRSLVLQGNLAKGTSTSCGCWNYFKQRETVHGHSRIGLKTKTYRSWDAMHQRCYNKKATNYKWYGARGLTVCRRWHKFENFLADMGERPAGCDLHRIDNDKGYEPGNCVWLLHSDHLKLHGKSR